MGMATRVADDAFVESAPPFAARDAILEASRCLDCGGPDAPAPCVAACPAGVDVPSFVAAIARNEPDQAARIVFAENVLGGTCSRACPAEVLCQRACGLVDEGQPPLQVARLQRYATDHALHSGAILRARAPYNWLQVAVIGAGPAGLAAAGELAARGYGVTVYDERREIGGLVRYAIDPQAPDGGPLAAEARLLAELGVSFEPGLAIDTPEALATVAGQADAVVLAVGLRADTGVRYPGDGLPGVWDALPFVEATRTGRLTRVGPSVAVIGGGNTAVEIARDALRLGARRVTVLYRRGVEEMPAYRHEVEQALAEGVWIEATTVPVRFVGGNRVQAIECRRTRLGGLDETGRRLPEEVPGSEFLVPVDTVVKATGRRPRVDFLRWIDGLELTSGLISVDPETGQTSNPAYFAAGDATNGGGTVAEAVRGAKVVARGIDAYLEHGWASAPRDRLTNDLRDLNSTQGGATWRHG